MLLFLQQRGDYQLVVCVCLLVLSWIWLPLIGIGELNFQHTLMSLGSHEGVIISKIQNRQNKHMNHFSFREKKKHMPPILCG
jgi:hypothetical protein